MAGYIITKRVQNLIISLKLATPYACTHFSKKTILQFFFIQKKA